MTGPRASLPGTRVLVLGFGITGRAVCAYAVTHSLAARVSESGRLAADSVRWLSDHHIPFEQEGHTARFLDESDFVIVSPGVPADSPILEQAAHRQLPIFSETDFAAGLVPDNDIIAVTGTNGKSSTVEVIGTLLRAAGRGAWVTGNIGVPLISVVDEVERQDVIVLEISSYQLEQSRGFRPRVGVLLNLSPDHVHRHGDVHAYARAKGKLFENQTPEDVAIMPSALANAFPQGHGRRVFYDRAFPDLPPGTDDLLPHEQSNLRAALAACQALQPGFDVRAIPIEAVRQTFRLPHRMEVVGRIRGVRVVNDSKSTNGASTIAALRSVREPVVLLLGGRHKGAGYEALADEMAASRVRRVILFGEGREMFEQLLGRHPEIVRPPLVVPTLEEAVMRGLAEASPGDVLLFSPACASFDAFANYAQRGDVFKALIRSHPSFEPESSRT